MERDLDVFVRDAVAVLVDKIAHLSRAGVNRLVAVIAVRTGFRCAGRHAARGDRLFGIAVAIAISIRVVGLLHFLIGRAVAVVVLSVAELGSSRENRDVVVVAVIAQDHRILRRLARLHRLVDVTVSVAIRIRVERDFDILVRVAVAVAVDAFANLLRTRVDARIIVIAIVAVCDIRALVADARARTFQFKLGIRIAVLVAVVIKMPRLSRVIDAAVAIIVDPVAAFAHARMDSRTVLRGIILAIQTVRDVPGRSLARRKRNRRIAEAITVTVLVEGLLNTLVTTTGKNRRGACGFD